MKFKNKKDEIRIWDMLGKQKMYDVNGNNDHNWNTQYKNIKVIPYDTALEFYKSKEWVYERGLIHHHFKKKNQFYCQSCGLDFNEDENRKHMTIDHIIALRTQYGWDTRFDPMRYKDYSNLQMLCRKCNENKSAKYYSSENTIQIQIALWLAQIRWISRNSDNLWNIYCNNLTRKQREKKHWKEWCEEQWLIMVKKQKSSLKF